MQKRKCRPAPPNTHCFYCGASATGFDHVIPYSVCGENTELVPACFECNSLLGATIFDSVWEKKSYLVRAIAKKYREILEMKIISTVGLTGNLKGEIERCLDRKEFIISRIEFASNNPIDKSSAFDSESAEEPLRKWLLSKRTYIWKSKFSVCTLCNNLEKD